MHSIPWLASVEEMPTLEIWVVVLGVAAAGLATGFTLDYIMGGAGFGPAANGILGLIGVALGVYLRYAVIGYQPQYDFYLSMGVPFVTSAVLLFILGFIKSRLA